MRSLQESRNILNAPDAIRAAVNALVGRDCDPTVRENPSDVVLVAPTTCVISGDGGETGAAGVRP